MLRLRAAIMAGLCAATSALAQPPAEKRAPPTAYAISAGPAANGTPAWRLRGSFPDPTGLTAVAPGGKVTVMKVERPRYEGTPPPCRKSPICTNPIGPARGTMQRVTYDQTLGYSYRYPIDLPPGIGGVPAVALDSKGNLWVYQRRLKGEAQLMKFDPTGRLVLSVPNELTGFALKAHGMAIDADDNVWIVDTALATARKISAAGTLLMTIGTEGRRGDWNEEKGQRLLWEPVMIAFGGNGDIYIAQGHGHESPTDAGGDDPANNLGTARILHLDRRGKFVAQYFGNNHGPGKFYSAHGFAVDPRNGDLWIGDREDYRIVVLTKDGRFVKTIATTNLVCAIQFDSKGEPWYASGQDGQFLKIDRNGKVLGAIGRGMGIGEGEFIEAGYWVFDKRNDLWAGDTSVGRVTHMRRR